MTGCKLPLKWDLMQSTQHWWPPDIAAKNGHLRKSAHLGAFRRGKTLFVAALRHLLMFL